LRSGARFQWTWAEIVPLPVTNSVGRNSQGVPACQK
jgi:hypothetical protein